MYIRDRGIVDNIESMASREFIIASLAWSEKPMSRLRVHRNVKSVKKYTARNVVTPPLEEKKKWPKANGATNRCKVKKKLFHDAAAVFPPTVVDLDMLRYLENMELSET